MANKGATFCRELREKAKADGKGLIAVDVDNKNGRWQSWGMMDHEMSSRLFLFVQKIYKGKTPREAMAEVWPES